MGQKKKKKSCKQAIEGIFQSLGDLGEALVDIVQLNYEAITDVIEEESKRKKSSERK